MSKSDLILIGAGGHARSCIDVIEQQGHFKICGLVGLPEQISMELLGYRVIGVDADLPMLVEKYQYALITIGQIEKAFHRIKLFQKATFCGFQLPAIISPFAYVSRSAKIGPGSIVMHGAIVNSGAKVGENCIINSNALIEHDVDVESHCHISTGAILNGGVSVGPRTFIGSGSVIKEGVKIHGDCTVGAGLTVRHNLAALTCFKG
uniref:acetyltransferase n=1 Tax=Polynucleobacter sp. TaxID=2029855 RepID=UPI0040478740